MNRTLLEASKPPMKTDHTLDGFLNIDKPAGWTSHDVVAKIRRLFHMQKVGHAGTLDPAATGVLPICMGKGTKVVEYLLAADKEYRAVLRLGEETDTLDATGKVLSRSEVNVSEEDLHSVLDEFRGKIEQIPPMYSAIKVQGVPLYKAARAGQKLALQPRTVTIRSLVMLSFERRDIALAVVCSKGTYIRSLCADIGKRLGCGGHLLQLERRRSGPFRLEEAVSIAALEELVAEGRADGLVYSLDRVLSGLPIVRVSAQAAIKIPQGAPFSRPDILELPAAFSRGDLVRIHGPTGGLVAIGRATIDLAESGKDPTNPLFKVEKVLS